VLGGRIFQCDENIKNAVAMCAAKDFLLWWLGKVWWKAGWLCS
jgi:hypothetical protein